MTASDDAPSHKADGDMLKGVRSIAADGQDTNVTRRAPGARTLLFYFGSTEQVAAKAIVQIACDAVSQIQALAAILMLPVKLRRRQALGP